MKFVSLLAVIAAVTAIPHPKVDRRERRDVGPVVPANYNFLYQVADSASKNYYSHQETRLVDDTQGTYYVRLPGDDSYTLFAYRVNPKGVNDPPVQLPPVPPKA